MAGSNNSPSTGPSDFERRVMLPFFEVPVY
jgi:hypothetical protein